MGTYEYIYEYILLYFTDFYEKRFGGKRAPADYLATTDYTQIASDMLEGQEFDEMFNRMKIFKTTAFIPNVTKSAILDVLEDPGKGLFFRKKQYPYEREKLENMLDNLSMAIQSAVNKKEVYTRPYKSLDEISQSDEEGYRNSMTIMYTATLGVIVALGTKPNKRKK